MNLHADVHMATLTSKWLHWLLHGYTNFYTATLTSTWLHWLLHGYTDFYTTTLTSTQLHWHPHDYTDVHMATLTSKQLRWLPHGYTDFHRATLTSTWLHWFTFPPGEYKHLFYSHICSSIYCCLFLDIMDGLGWNLSSVCHCFNGWLVGLLFWERVLFSSPDGFVLNM